MVQQDVLLIQVYSVSNRIAEVELVFVVIYHRAVKKMVLQPIVLPVSVDQLNVLQIQVYSVSKQTLVQEFVTKTDTGAVNKIVLQPTMLPVSAGQLNVLLLNLIAIKLLVCVVLYHRAA